MLQRDMIVPLARVAFVGALVLAVTLALTPPMHVEKVGDKSMHMLAFGTLTLLAAFGWPQLPRFRILERLSFLGAMIEVLQSIPSLHRDCDIRDWIADTIAILAVLLVLRLLGLPKAE
jgi:hypothetical protein